MASYRAFSIFVFVLTLWSGRISAGPYVITDLGTLGGAYSWATGINNNGQVVGYADTSDGTTHAFLYSSGVMTDLGTFGGTSSWATGINDSGGVAGNTDIDAGIEHGILRSGGVTTDLSSALGGINSWATGINNNAEVVGYTSTAFLYSNGVITDLGSLGGQGSAANAINNQSHVAGAAATADFIAHAFLWRNGAMMDLGDLGGSGSWAYGINDIDQVVGNSEVSPGLPHAFLWNGVAMIDIDTLGTTGSWAYDINNNGEVVGTLARSGSEAFIYKNGSMTTLNSLLCDNSGWTIDGAEAINDQGQIAGVGSYNGQQHAVLLTPNTVVTDISLTLTAKPSKVLAGKPVTYLARVTNNGPLPATDVVVSGSLPTCVIGNLPVGASASCQSTVTPTLAGTLTQSMSVCNNEADSKPVDNKAYVNTSVRGVADIALAMSGSAAKVTVGTELAYSLTITNNGPSDSSNVLLENTLPANSSFVGAYTWQGTCAANKRGVSCTINYLPAGAQAVVYIVVTPKRVGNLVNSAVISAPDFDPVRSNNFASLMTTIINK